MSIIYFHKVLCWFMMGENSDIVKGGLALLIVVYGIDICDLPELKKHT